MNRYSWENVTGVICVGLLMCGSAVGGTYSGGDGSSGTPYLIGSSTDWLELIATPADWDKHFEQTADIDFGGVTIKPVGTSAETPFAGVFDGKDFVIRNATINKTLTDNVGLFGYCSADGGGGILQHIQVENVTVKGRHCVGLLAGYSSGEISFCTVSGTVSGKDQVGGLVGYLFSGALTDDHADCAVTGAKNVGGLAGSVEALYEAGFQPIEVVRCSASGTVTTDGWSAGGLIGNNKQACSVTDCHALGAVTAEGSAGGLVGANKGPILSCYATGAVTCLNNTGYSVGAGGLVGYNEFGNITACYATGAVIGAEGVGGLVGKSTGGSEEGIIRSSFATGPVNGSTAVGGLVGNAWHIVACYATGTVAGDTQVGSLCGDMHIVVASYATGPVSGTTCAGGLVGITRGCLGWDCFWDMDSTGMNTSPVGKGLSSSQMREALYYSAANWAAYDWVMNAGALPRLAWENTGAGVMPEPPELPYSGSGTPEDPYQITTAEEFAWLSWNVRALDKHFRLMNDIDLEGVRLYPIGDAYPWQIELSVDFTGVFEGAGNRLLNVSFLLDPENCSLTDDVGVGLFCSVGETGEVRNLILSDAVVNNARVQDQFFGFIAGDSSGRIFNCQVTGAFHGIGYAGALVGANLGEIASCSVDFVCEGNLTEGSLYFGGVTVVNRGRISDTRVVIHGEGRHIGGITKDNDGEIVGCHVEGILSGVLAGGIATSNTGLITRCSSKSQVTEIQTEDADIDDFTRCGGIAGGNSIGGEISSCFATGTVRGRNNTGGLVGWMYRASVVDSYSRCLVYDKDPGAPESLGALCLGGLIGFTQGPGNVINCYAAGSMRKNSNDTQIGGLIAERAEHSPVPSDGIAYVESSYWDTQVSGVYSSDGGSGRNTGAMTYPYASGVYEGWDFTDTWAADETSTQNDGYPWLPAAVAQELPKVSLRGASRVEKNGYTVLRVTVEANKGPLTVYWYLNGMLVQSGPETEYVIPYASDLDAGTYHAIVMIGDGAYYRSQELRVRVLPEGSLPALSPSALLLLALLLSLFPVYTLKKRCR